MKKLDKIYHLCVSVYNCFMRRQFLGDKAPFYLHSGIYLYG